MIGSIVYKGKSLDGTPFVIAYPKETDVKSLQSYINALSSERTFISFQGEQVTLREEKDFLDKRLEKIRDKKTVMLLMISKKRVVGVGSIELGEKVHPHIGNLGISLASEFRGMGLGKLFLEFLLKEAKKNLSGLKIITLTVFVNNKVAIQMYKNFGFKEYGRLPKGVIHKGNKIDYVYMYKTF